MALAALMLFWCDPSSLWKDWMVGGEKEAEGREGRGTKEGEKEDRGRKREGGGGEGERDGGTEIYI